MRMKRIFKLLGLVMILFFIYQMVIVLFVKEHVVTYQIGKGKDTFEVHESFQIKNKKHFYRFKVKDKKKNSYYFQIEENLHKKDKIIQKIESYQNEDLYCIYPVYSLKKQSEIICQEKDQLFTGTYLETKKDERIVEFEEKLKKKGYSISGWKTKNTPKKYQKVTYYPENILKNQAFYFWTYKGIINLVKDNVYEQQLFEIDQYENNKSILLGTTLIVIDTEQDYDFDRIYLLSLFNKKKEVIKLKEKISKDSYFLGSVQDKVYLIDRKNIKQYEIDIQKKTCKEIGNKGLNAKYYQNGKWKIRNIYDFVQEDILFEEEIPSKIKKLYPNQKILKQDEIYYLIEGNTVSYILSLYPKQRIYLFTLDDLKEIKVDNEMIFAVSKDTVYSYQEKKGLCPILTSRELLFHTQNMYGVAFKN